MSPSDHQLVILVCARHLDYTNSQSLLKTVAKHPQDGSLTGDVGHAWVLLKSGDEIIEGGHSGELGLDESRYFDGIMDLIEAGDPNPVRYMHHTLHDGYFESGSGGFFPTYAIKKTLTYEQAAKIRHLITHYDYREYSLTKRQCLVFVNKVAQIAGLHFETDISIPVAKYAHVGNHQIKLWTNETYATLQLMSPDVLEKSLMEAVYAGEAEYALDWYRKTHYQGSDRIEWGRLFERLAKLYLFQSISGS